MTREEAINEIRSWDFLEGKEIEAIRTLIPELAESKDEKIRKDIIGGLMWQRDNLKSEGPHDNNLILPGFCLTVGEHLAYLEKQKGQQPTDSEKSNEHPEWSEEDEKMYQNLIHNLGVICEKVYPHNIHLKKELNWFKSLRPQPKQEWSEEDYNAILIAIDWLKYYRDVFVVSGEAKDEISACVDRLKSLRPQHHWKPSEEQMETLKDVINRALLTCRQQVPLESLLSDLKKL